MTTIIVTLMLFCFAAIAKRTPTVGRLMVLVIEGANLSTGEDGMSLLTCLFSLQLTIIELDACKLIQMSSLPWLGL